MRMYGSEFQCCMEYNIKELGTSRNLRGEEWSEENRLILYHGKVYIPLDSKL